VVLDGDMMRDCIEHYDFSLDGRLKQGRMIDCFSREMTKQGFNVVCSFIAPLDDTKKLFYDDSFIIFVDTVKPEDNKYEDTGRVYQKPSLYHYHVTSKTNNIESLIKDIMIEYNYWLVSNKNNYNI